MEAISKARNDVVRKKIKAFEMFSKNIQLDLSHAISISLSVVLFGRTRQYREIIILLHTANLKVKTMEDRHDKDDSVHTIYR